MLNLSLVPKNKETGAPIIGWSIASSQVWESLVGDFRCNSAG